MVWLQMVPRKTAEIMSAAPAKVKNARAPQMVGASPASAMNAP
jgi:hypothetical protein